MTEIPSMQLANELHFGRLRPCLALTFSDDFVDSEGFSQVEEFNQFVVDFSC